MTAATLVDHQVPIAIDPSKRLDPDNLRSLCSDCHAEVTGRWRSVGINEPCCNPLADGGWAGTI